MTKPQKDNSGDNESVKDFNSILDNPSYFFELKDEEFPMFHKNSSLSLESPGFHYNTPSNNPFGYFQSSQTPQGQASSI